MQAGPKPAQMLKFFTNRLNTKSSGYGFGNQLSSKYKRVFREGLCTMSYTNNRLSGRYTKIVNIFSNGLKASEIGHWLKALQITALPLLGASESTAHGECSASARVWSDHVRNFQRWISLGVRFLLLCAALIASATPSKAQSTLPPFTCVSAFYETIDGQLSLLNIATGEYDPIGPDQPQYNGTGYNVNDDYVYGFGQEGPIDDHLIRVGSDGSIESLGFVGFTSPRGVFDGTNRLFYRGNSNSFLYIDVTTLTTGSVPFTLASGSPGLNAVLDYAYTVKGGQEYIVGARDGDVLIWNLTTGVSRRVTVPGLPDTGFGAAWGANNGSVYFSANSTGVNYEILDIDTTPIIGATINAELSTAHDGMSCADAPPPFVSGPGLTIDKEASPDIDVQVGETVTYTYTVTNVGSTVISDVTISDVHGGAGALGTIAPDALANNSGNSSDDGADGDFDTLAPTDVITFTAEYVVARGDADSTVSNTATANGSPASGSLSPPSADAEISVAPSIEVGTIGLVKSSVLNDDDGVAGASPGDTIDYTYVVTNTSTTLDVYNVAVTEPNDATNPFHRHRHTACPGP